MTMRTGRIVSIWKCDKCGVEAEGDYYLDCEHGMAHYGSCTPTVESDNPTGWWVTTEVILCPDCNEYND